MRFVYLILLGAAAVLLLPTINRIWNEFAPIYLSMLGVPSWVWIGLPYVVIGGLIVAAFLIARGKPHAQ